MPQHYGFPVKIKTAAGPRIKYFSVYMDDDAAALAFAGHLSSDVMANNGKVDVNNRILINGEQNYELPEGYTPTNENWPTYLVSVVNNGTNEVEGQQYLTIPCVRPSYDLMQLANDIVGHVQVYCNDGTYRVATHAKLIRSISYQV